MRHLQRGVFFVLLLGAPAGALAQPYSAGVSVDISISGEPVPSVDVFYDQLSPYGVWLNDPYFGRVFIPDQDNFVPYRDGYWQYTNIGFVWVSSEPFAWATTHYGRWVYSRAYERWAWRPDTTWGPSWVEWRMYGDYYGWAPLAPEIGIQIGYAPPIEAWHYCAAPHIFDRNVARYYEPQPRVIEYQRVARPIDNYANIGGRRFAVGPPAASLRQHHLDVAPTPIEPRAAGRWTPTETRDAVKRAQDQRAVNDALNTKRIESKPALREAQKHVQQTPQPRPPAVQQPRPTPVQQPKPTQVQQPRPTQVQQPRPTQVQQPKPTPVQQPRPTPVQQPRPTPVQQPRPTQVQQPKPTPVEQPRPTHVQQPRPTQTQQPRPTEQPKPVQQQPTAPTRQAPRSPDKQPDHKPDRK